MESQRCMQSQGGTTVSDGCEETGHLHVKERREDGSLLAESDQERVCD